MTKNYPSKTEWFIAAAIFIFLFMSFCYIDTTSIIRFEVGFAESLLKGDVKDLYGVTYNNALYAKANELRGSHFPTYDLPMNIVLGIWGIPLYLYRTWFNAPDIGESFGQMLYGKSILLPALIITIILVYKICLALGTDKNRALWGAYLYFTSAIVTGSIAIIGQSDVIGMTLILAGLLAFIRRESKKFMLFFVLAMPFKMYAMFFFLPLMLLREKGIHIIIIKLLTASSLTVFSTLSLIGNHEALRSKATFNAVMLLKLVSVELPALHSNASLFVLLFGFLCIWCYVHEESDDHAGNMRLINFVSVLSAVVLFISFPSYPYWFVYLAPYLAVCSVFCAGQSKNIVLFETLGMVALSCSNYIIYWWCYDIPNTVDMFLHRITGSPAFREGALTLSAIAHSYALNKIPRISDAVYIVCMCAVAWLCRQDNDKFGLSDSDMRLYARMRLLLNTVILMVPVLLFINAVR